MNQERPSLADELEDMQYDEIRAQLAPVLQPGEEFTDEDIDRIKQYALTLLKKNNQSVTDALLSAAADRLKMKEEKLDSHHFPVIGPDGVVHAVGNSMDEAKTKQRELAEDFDSK